MNNYQFPKNTKNQKLMTAIGTVAGLGIIIIIVIVSIGFIGSVLELIRIILN